jgi:hypothetical protein
VRQAAAQHRVEGGQAGGQRRPLDRVAPARHPQARHTMVDGLIVLSSRLAGWRAEREIEVRKFRGGGFPSTGSRRLGTRRRASMRGNTRTPSSVMRKAWRPRRKPPPRITDDGVRVFPRIEARLRVPSRRDPVEGPALTTALVEAAEQARRLRVGAEELQAERGLADAGGTADQPPPWSAVPPASARPRSACSSSAPTRRRRACSAASPDPPVPDIAQEIVADLVDQPLGGGLPHHPDPAPGGGLPHASTTLVGGPAGIGKTTLGLQFLGADPEAQARLDAGKHPDPVVGDAEGVAPAQEAAAAELAQPPPPAPPCCSSPAPRPGPIWWRPSTRWWTGSSSRGRRGSPRAGRSPAAAGSGGRPVPRPAGCGRR